MYMICTAIEDHAEVRGRCCHQKPFVSPRSVLLLTVKGKEVTFTVVLMTAGSYLINRDIKGFYDNPYSLTDKVTA